MMKRILIFLPAAILFSCGGNGEKKGSADTLSDNKPGIVKIDSSVLIRSIGEAEKRTAQSKMIIEDTAAMLIRLYTDYSTAYPGDSARTPVYLFKAAGVAKYAGETVSDRTKSNAYYNQAISLLKKVQKYPQFNAIEEAYYMEAMIYDVNLKNLGMARQSYNDFIKRFPASPMVPSAKAAIELLGKDDSEIIEEYKKKNKV